MVLTRKMKARGITEEDNIAANTLLQLHKDNSILKKLKDDMVNKEYLKKERAKQEIIKQIEMWNSTKDKFANVIHECKKELEKIDVELAKIISELDNL
tara:strand:- start:42 stop:335 length:294 start_codon:yes stop_codon:yes gene_type:complete